MIRIAIELPGEAKFVGIHNLGSKHGDWTIYETWIYGEDWRARFQHKREHGWLTCVKHAFEALDIAQERGR